MQLMKNLVLFFLFLVTNIACHKPAKYVAEGILLNITPQKTTHILQWQATTSTDFLSYQILYANCPANLYNPDSFKVIKTIKNFDSNSFEIPKVIFDTLITATKAFFKIKINFNDRFFYSNVVIANGNAMAKFYNFNFLDVSMKHNKILFYTIILGSLKILIYDYKLNTYLTYTPPIGLDNYYWKFLKKEDGTLLLANFYNANITLVDAVTLATLNVIPLGAFQSKEMALHHNFLIFKDLINAQWGIKIFDINQNIFTDSISNFQFNNSTVHILSDEANGNVFFIDYSNTYKVFLNNNGKVSLVDSFSNYNIYNAAYNSFTSEVIMQSVVESRIFTNNLVQKQNISCLPSTDNYILSSNEKYLLTLNNGNALNSFGRLNLFVLNATSKTVITQFEFYSNQISVTLLNYFVDDVTNEIFTVENINTNTIISKIPF
jgi:hypothetical protein